MSQLPFALSVHSFVDKVGADAGFASIVGLAVLILIFFSQARETTTLREHAEQAAERIRQLEGQVATLARAAQAARTANSGQRVAAAARPAVAGSGSWVGAPAGVGAPALADATKLVPAPVSRPAPVAVPTGAPGGARVPTAVPLRPAPAGPADPGLVPAGGDDREAALAGALAGDGAPTPLATPRPATAAGASGVLPVPLRGGGGNGSGNAGAPPRVQIRAGGGARRALPPEFSLDEPPPRPPWVRVAAGVVVVVVVVGVIVGVVSATSGPARHPGRSSSRSHGGAAGKIVRVNPSHITVAVLNGTPVYHLALDGKQKLLGFGFRVSSTGNAASQTHGRTLIEYLTSSDRIDALAVAKALGLPPSHVVAVSSSDEQVACSGSGACSDNVIVVVGQDLQRLSAGSGSTAGTPGTTTNTPAGTTTSG
jgi:hypothetical protein